MLQEINSSKNKIDNIIDKVEELNRTSDDLELVSHMTRYLCVLVSGYFEKSIYSLLMNYSKNKSHPNISNYFYNEFKSFTNARTDKIITLLNKFNSDWETVFTGMEDYDEIKASINSLVGQRHLIAHGNDSNIGFVSLKKYYKSINKVITFIEENFFEKN